MTLVTSPRPTAPAGAGSRRRSPSGSACRSSAGPRPERRRARPTRPRGRRRRRPALPARLDGRRLGHARGPHRRGAAARRGPPPRARAEIRAFAQAGAASSSAAAPPCVLRDDPRALHVLLDGPVEARIAPGDGHRAHRPRDRASPARAHGPLPARLPRGPLRRRRPEPGVFHLVLDSTVIALGDCVELIAAAARAHAR